MTSARDAGGDPDAALDGSGTIELVEQRRASIHRTDIDGLRALAVTSVVLLHAGFGVVSGGFLGVDVFFVISGYLIHKDLSRRLETGTFAVAGFYGRRMRRTLPALYLVTAATLTAGWLVMMPGDFDAAARSAGATVLSVSNIFFLTQVGYFDHDALSKPLLHTWSLGVEEQFYLLAPLLALALHKLRARRRSAYAALLVATFGLCWGLQRAAPAAAFFLMPPRIWEFLIGCAIADQVVPPIRLKAMAEGVTVVSLVALIGSFFVVSAESAHPGIATIAPCVATAAIIHAGGTWRTLVGRLLGWRPVAFIGLISYSLYLWHWPLIVFSKYLDLTITPITVAVELAGVLLLSIVSWRYVERPFRDPASPLRRRAAPVLAGSLLAVLVASVAVVAARGVPGRFPADVAKITSYYDYADRREFREGRCFLTTKFASLDDFDRSLCLTPARDKPNYLLIGDSLAAHYWIGLATVYPEAHILQATASGCKPTLDPKGKAYCVDLIDDVLKTYLPKTKLDGIIFSAAWDIADAAAVARTVAYAARYTPAVIVLGSVPLHDADLPTLLGKSLIGHDPDLVTAHQLDYPWQVQDAFEDALPARNFMSVLDLLCPNHRCLVLADKTVPLQFDKSHLTSEGSILVARRLKESGMLKRP